MYTSIFWKDAFERVLSTVAQTLIAVLSADGFDLLAVDATATFAIVATAGALSLLKAIIAAKAVPRAVSPASLAGI